MKSILTLCGFVLLGSLSFAQSPDNTLPPNGNVGIGTLNPSAKLDVNGNMKVDSTLLVKDSVIIEKDARIVKDLFVEGSLFLPNIDEINNENSNFLVVKENGETKSMNKNELIDLIYGSDCNAVGDDGNGNTLYEAPVWHSEAVPNNQTGYLFTGTNCPAKVGIGTSTPDVALDVQGTTYSKRIAIGNISPLQMEGNLHIKKNAPLNNNGKIILVENNQRYLLQLDNSGLLRAREIKVDADVWPDYVFDDNYKLMSLNEIETFIEQNGHLPNVPSASEVEKEGQNLGEMNKILLEKIEELTLLMIAQQKEIDQLKEQIQNKE